MCPRAIPESGKRNPRLCFIPSPGRVPRCRHRLSIELSTRGMLADGVINSPGKSLTWGPLEQSREKILGSARPFRKMAGVSRCPPLGGVSIYVPPHFSDAPSGEPHAVKIACAVREGVLLLYCDRKMACIGNPVGSFHHPRLPPHPHPYPSCE